MMGEICFISRKIERRRKKSRGFITVKPRVKLAFRSRRKGCISMEKGGIRSLKRFWFCVETFL
jgi:hypothetical protein